MTDQTLTDPSPVAHATARTTCRICGERLVPILTLGSHYLPDFPHSAGTRTYPAVPLELVRCPSLSCGLVQLAHTTPPSWLYGQYWYRSGVNEAMRAELADVVQAALSKVTLPKHALVADIGANDGTLLSMYRGHNITVSRVAWEPARNLYQPCRQHAEILFPEFFAPMATDWVTTKVHVLTSIAMFYDLDDPHRFVQDAAGILHRDGVWVIQQAYLPAMLETLGFDNICLPPGSPIITRCGLRAIETIDKGTPVLTAAGSYHLVEQLHRREYSGDLVELTAYGFGYTLQVTPEHPIRVQRADNHWRWIPAGEVRQGDIVCRPTPHTVDRPSALSYSWGHGRGEYTLHALPITETFLEVAGYYLAEGSIGSRHNGVTFYFGHSETEKQLAARCAHLIERLGFTARVRPGPSTTRVHASGPLARLLKEQFGHGAGVKHLPPWAFALTVPESRVLIEAYMRGDGYRYRTTYWRGSTISGQLALDMAMLANRAGWHASLCKQKPAPHAFKHRGRPSKTQPLWDVLIQTKPQKRLKVWLDAEGNQCGRVRKITRTPYTGPVYNLGVAVERTYVSPAMTVHNCHEHLEYYHLAPLERLLWEHGLEVFDVEHRAINAGSFRAYVGHKGRRPVLPRVAQMQISESRMALGAPQGWVRWATAVSKLQNRIITTVCGAVDQGLVVDVIGASTKGHTLLQACGLDARVIRQAWERSPEKIGRFYGATGIPIVYETEGRGHGQGIIPSEPPPDLLLALAWQFREGLIEREAEYLARGGRMVFPMPGCEVVGG